MGIELLFGDYKKMKKIFNLYCAVLLCLLLAGSSAMAEETTYAIRKLFFDKNGFSWYDAADKTKEEFMNEYNRAKLAEQRDEQLKDQAEQREIMSKKLGKLEKERIIAQRKANAELKKANKEREKMDKRRKAQEKINKMKSKWNESRARAAAKR